VNYSYVLYDSSNRIVQTFIGPRRIAKLLGSWELPVGWSIERIHSAVTNVGAIVTPAEVLAHAAETN